MRAQKGPLAKGRGTAAEGGGGGEKPAGGSISVPDESQPDKSEDKSGEPDKSQEPAEIEPQKPAVPAEMTYTFDTATGTLTCSGGGEIKAGGMAGFANVIKNAIFETNWGKCKQAIKKVVIEDGVTAIGESAFSELAITEITIPDSVTWIGSDVFYNTQITSVTIPDSVTEVGEGVFEKCENLSSATLSKNLTAISEDMFYGCTNLTSIQIPEGVTTIKDDAFRECGLTSITIPDGVTSIGSCVFTDCPITQITIPASVTDFSYTSLYNKSLTDITFLGDTDMDHVEGWFQRIGVEYPVTVHAPAGSVIEGYLNRQISEYGAKCAFVPLP